tara:strand:+ start:25564 stop:25788 length:225 start_codon:yes stop_codon:yes gene_type:complete
MQGESAELKSLLDQIRPGIDSVDRVQNLEQRIAAAVETNARTSAKQLRIVPSIAKAMHSKKCRRCSRHLQVGYW